MLQGIVPLLALLLFSALARAAESELPTPAPSAEPPSEAVVGDLPFLASDEPNRIVVNLAPDGYAPFRMMIDTGAGASVLTPRYAEKLHVTVERAKDTPYRRATRLGRDVQFWVDVRNSDTASKTGWEYGLLGGTFLREYVVEFDFAARHVRFLDPERYRVPESVAVENEAVVPIKVVANRPLVDISIGGRVVQVMLDTGMWDSGVLSGAAAHQVEISSTPLPGLGAGSVLGPVEVEFTEADRLRLGPFELTHVPLLVAPKGWYNIGPSTDSVIGYDILSQFTVRLDYPRQRLWLRRRSNVEVTYCGQSYALQRSAGLLICEYPRGLRVAALFPDSAAAHLGILPGDILLSPSGWTTGLEAKMLESVATGEHVRVARRVNGTSVEMSLPQGSGDSSPTEPKH